MNYSFETLAPDDFERLVHDLLLTKHLSLEAFKTGRDGGIDLRYSSVRNRNDTVVQCKRYENGANARLKRVIENEELPKIMRLNPRRYILATSVELSSLNKQNLKNLLGQYCLTTADILGRDDLNSILRKYPRIERRHFKLWLTSVTVLKRVLHAGIYNRSSFEIDQLRNEIARFVPVPCLRIARALLRKHHYCIIAGIPGIGKTTLAKLLLSQYAAEGWEVVTVSENISEAWETLETTHDDTNTKIVFYYDDFLGQNTLKEKLAKNEESRLLNFMKFVGQRPNIRFILTTREYILEQASQNYEQLDREKQHLIKCTVMVEELDKAIRTKILFNHLYFSDIDKAKVRAFLKSKTYRKVIEHDSFNPRIVSYICTARNFRKLSPKQYVTAVLKELDDPKAVWKHPFERHLNDQQRFLCYILLTSDGRATLDFLEEGLRNCLPDESGRTLRLEPHLKVLDGTFLKINQVQRRRRNQASELKAEFHNPSIVDFLQHQLANNHPQIRLLIEGCQNISQFHYLWNARDDQDDHLFRSTILKYFKILFFNNLISKLSVASNADTALSWRIGHILDSVALFVDFSTEANLRSNRKYKATLSKIIKKQDIVGWRTGYQAIFAMGRILDSLSLVIARQPLEEDLICCARKLASRLITEYMDVDDCAQLSNAIARHQEYFPDKERRCIFEKIAAHASDYAQIACNEKLHSGEYDSIFSSLESVEYRTHISLIDTKSQIIMARDEAKMSEDEADDEEDPSESIESSREHISDTDIDNLFQLVLDQS
jgi:adenylate kinase family enzyme